MRQMKYRTPFDWMRNIGRLRISALPKVIRRADQRKAFRIGEARKWNGGARTPPASSAVGASHPLSRNAFAAIRGFELHGDRVCALHDIDQARREPNFGVRNRLEHLAQERGELVLLTMQAKRKRRLFLEQ